MRGNINDCTQYTEAILSSSQNSDHTLFPLGQYKNFTYINNMICPNCGSHSQSYGDILWFKDILIKISELSRLFKNKKYYCLNDSCPYHYMEFNKNSKAFNGNPSKIISFVKLRLRKEKMKNIK